MSRARGGSRRPNRGGGRFNYKPARTANRAAIEKDRDELDDSEDDEEFDDIVPEIREPSPEGRQTTRAKNKSKFSTKALIQKLHMSAENREMVEEVLRDLQIARSGHDFKGNLDFDAREIRRNEVYWRKFGDQKLAIEGGINFAGDQNDADVESKDEIYSSYAVKKLLQCGFEKKRCIDALRVNNGDLGAALQTLLFSCCKLNQLGKESPHYTDEKFQEAVLQRQEEAMALESIYDEAFTEVIADSVWNIRLSLSFLLDAFKPKINKKNECKSKTVKTPGNVCRFFLQGFCRFGDRCRLNHVTSDEKASSNETKPNIPEITDANNETTDPSFPFNLEVRFSKGSLYPFEPPMVAFYSTHDSIPSSGCLNVTLRLNRETKALCDAESPAIFYLASLLENEEEIMECFKMPPSEFSLPAKKSITIQSVENKCINDYDDKREATNKKPQVNQPCQSLDQLTAQDRNRKFKQQFERLQVNVYGFSLHHPSSPLQQSLFPHWIITIPICHSYFVYFLLKSVPAYKSMLEERKKLPAWKSQQNIIETLQNHQVVVISGMTG